MSPQTLFVVMEREFAGALISILVMTRAKRDGELMPLPSASHDNVVNAGGRTQYTKLNVASNASKFTDFGVADFSHDRYGCRRRHIKN